MFPQQRHNARSGQSNQSSQLIVLDSRDRFSPTQTSVGDFVIDLIPKDGTITSLTLKHASLPFAFRNVTFTYGHQILLRVYPDRTLPLNHIIPIDIDPGYYSVSNLIAAINLQIAAALGTLGYPWTLTISFSSSNGILALNTTNQLVKVEFDPTVFDINLRYVYNMLGLSYLNITTISGYDVSGVFSLPFPFFATQELPFRGILISMDVYPDDVFTTGRVSGLFFIPTHGYNALETLLSSPNHSAAHGLAWNENMQFTQTVVFEQSLKNLQTVRVRLFDLRGNPLTEHFQENDFILVMEAEKNKIY